MPWEFDDRPAPRPLYNQFSYTWTIALAGLVGGLVYLRWQNETLRMIAQNAATVFVGALPLILSLYRRVRLTYRSATRAEDQNVEILKQLAEIKQRIGVKKKEGETTMHEFFVQTTADPSLLLEKARQGSAESGITFEGDETGGQFAGEGVTGQYVVEANGVHITLTSKPFFVGWGFVEAKVREFFS
jgi:hypothetical protein